MYEEAFFLWLGLYGEASVVGFVGDKLPLWSGLYGEASSVVTSVKRGFFCGHICKGVASSVVWYVLYGEINSDVLTHSSPIYPQKKCLK